MFLISPSPALPPHSIASAVPPSPLPSTLQLFQKLMRNKIAVDNHQGCLLLGWGARETWDTMRVGGSCHSGNGSTNSLGKSAAPETDFILGVLHSFQGPV